VAKDWSELPPEEAIAYLQSLAPMTDAEELYYAERAATRAFRVAGVYKLNVLQDMLESMEDALRGDLAFDEFVAQFAETGLTAGRLETVIRTGLQSAFGRGNWEQGTNSDVSNDIWGWRYITAGDDLVRPEHEELEGQVFQTGEADEIFPPWDYNCRCVAEWITVLEAEEEGLESSAIPDGVREAIGETDFVSPALRDDYEPDLGDYDIGLVREYLTEGEPN
jgi:SPP1 gp7 family putative phage head morphogenesis protein